MSDCSKQLREHGFKVTPKREAIVEFFEKKQRSLTPEEVWEPLKKRFGRLGLPSVYRNLETLVECGILTRIHSFDNRRHYALCHAHDGHHHHHVVCLRCGKVGEYEGCGLKDIRKAGGFRVTRHFLQLEGFCEDCQGKEKKT